MTQFLRETWELYYWAMFCPSRLQKRINEWVPRQGREGESLDTDYINVLLLQVNRRFLAQFFVLVLLLSIPLSVLIITQGEPTDSLLLLMALVSAYGVSFWSLPLGCNIPWLFTLLYLSHPSVLAPSWSIAALLSISKTLALSMAIATPLFVIGIIISYGLLFYEQRLIGYTTLTMSVALGIGVGVAQLNFSSFWTWFCVGAAAGLSLLVFVGKARSDVFAHDVTTLSEQFATDVKSFARGIPFGLLIASASSFPVSLAGAMISGLEVVGKDDMYNILLVAIGITMAISVVLLSISLVIGLADRKKGVLKATLFLIFLLPLMSVAFILGLIAFGSSLLLLTSNIAFITEPYLYLLGVLIGISLSPTQDRRFLFLASFILLLPAIADPSRILVLAFAVSTLWLSYHHLLPTYTLLAPLTFWSARQWQELKNVPRWLHWLPPQIDELLWPPLPGHDRILAAAFRTNTSIGLEALKQMRASPMSGLQHTVQRALPLILTDQLQAVIPTADIVAVADPKHPVLSFIVPGLYQFDEPETPLPGNLDLEIATMLPRLQTIAHDVEAALQVSSVFLRERGLERSRDNLRMLQGQIPGLLKAQAQPRWQAVVGKWQRVLEEEISRQQVDSQDETINPFQDGNPLSGSRAHLFKGRRRFADDIVRWALDRARPTLVLHGPRRFGKSSFLLNLPRLLPSDMIPVYIDIQSAAMTESEGDFCYGLVRAMHRDARSQGMPLPAPQRAGFQANPYPALEDWLDEARFLLGGRRLLLCLDHFEGLANAIAQGKLNIRILDQLRHLIQHRDELSFLFCGVQTLEELGPTWSSYFISVQPIEMLYLEPAEARGVLEDPDPRFDLRYAEGIVERVLEESACQPYLLQLLGELMVKQANQAESHIVTSPLLDAALDDALMRGTFYFTNLWKEATGSSLEEQRAGQALLYAVAVGQRLPNLEDESARAALRRLERYHVLQRYKEEYHIEIPLVARWVRERAYQLRGEIMNPFQSGNPLMMERADLFKGRQQFANVIRQVLGARDQTMVLYGPRRCGKSSFLLNLPRLLPDNLLPAYVDLQSAATMTSEGDFCFGIVRAITNAFRVRNLQAPSAQRDDFYERPYPVLEDWLDHARPMLQGRSLLICLDEFENLVSALDQGILSERLFHELRHLSQHRNELSLLVCGVQTLDELGKWSSYFINAQAIEMLYLKPEEARAVLEHPTKHFELCYGPGIVEQVLTQTSCQPCLLQLIGEKMVKQANQARTLLITSSLLDSALEDALTAGTFYFNYIWHNCTGTTSRERAVGQALLRAVAAGQPLPNMDDPTRAALHRLERHHVLQRCNDGYGFEIPLVARWVRERAV